MKKIIITLLFIVFLTGCSFKQDHLDLSNSKVMANVDTSNIEWAFTQHGGDPRKLLIEKINNAQTSIDIAIYSITDNNIKKAIIDAKKRNVQIRIITDKQESSSKYQSTLLSELKQIGIPIKINSHSGLMHLKIAIIDGKIIGLGSFNYTNSASTINNEDIFFVNDSKIATEWEKAFQDMWDNKNPKDQFIDFN